MIPPTFTCPVQSIRYSLVKPPPNEIYLQYCTFASPTTPRYDAESQGWINQLFCEEVAGLPAAPTSIAFSTKFEGLQSTFIGEEAPPFEETDDAQLLQMDFWLVLPPTINTIGVSIGDTKADATALWFGPSLGDMCPVAEFIEVANNIVNGVDNWVGFGNRTGFYNIPATVSQDCNLNILRGRMYISDIEAFWDSDPLIDIGNGPQSINNIPTIAALSPTDDDPPTLELEDGGMGFVDANGNVFDLNGNWIPVACQTPGTDPTLLADLSISATSICLDDPAPNYTITGQSGSMITYNINGGPPITITLDPSGMATIPATIPVAPAVSSTLNLVSVGSLVVNCAETFTVITPPTASVSGTTTICNGDPADYTFTGPPNSVITYTLNGV